MSQSTENRARVRHAISSSLELSIEAGEPRELEHGEKRLAVELRTPVPCRGQPAVNATARKWNARTIGDWGQMQQQEKISSGTGNIRIDQTF